MGHLLGLDIEIFPREYMRAALLLSLLTVWVLVGLFYYLNRYTKRYYFTIWTAAWLFYALWLTLGITVPQPSPDSWVPVMRLWCVSLSTVFLLWGSLSFLEMQVRQSLLGCFALFLLTWSYASKYILQDSFLIQFPTFLLIGLASMFCGFCFYRLRKNRPFLAVGMLVLGFFFWGIYLISYPVSIKYETLINAGFLFSAVLQLFIAVSMIVLVLEEARHINRKILEQVESTNREKRELQLKVLSAEEKCHTLFEQAHSREELQAAYNELRQTQQSVMQQERLRALGQMASGVAHDLNNALSPILAFSELLLKKEVNLSESSRKNLEHIRVSAEDVAQIVARLSEFYRRRDKNDQLRLASANRLMQQVIDLTSPCWQDIPQSRGLAIKIETDFDPAVPDLFCNQSDLREALTNIVLNAVDALPDGGCIKLATRTLSRRLPGVADGQPTDVVLEISDNGVGMDETTRERCMEPFFSTKQNRGGSGLGLAMVYGAVERHEGRVEIESQLHKGTTIRLVLPLRQSSHPEQVLFSDQKHQSGCCRILCVDDEPLLREMLNQLLEFEGHHTETAASGQEAIEKFEKSLAAGEPFRIVITDLGMPGMDGRQVARKIKQLSPGTPVILLTGWGNIMDQQENELKCIDAVLTKPPRPKELIELIARVMKEGCSSAAAQVASGEAQAEPAVAS